jgi:uncharacterized membrane protein (DUF373 family)
VLRQPPVSTSARAPRRAIDAAAGLKAHGIETKRTGSTTAMLGNIRNGWAKRSLYEWFEHFALVSLMFVIALITLIAFCVTIAQLFADLGATFMDKVALQDTFGSILTVLILLEFNHSIFVALTQRTGAIQVRVVVLIAILVVVRKMMLLDFSSTTVELLLGLGGLLLCLGGLYWLLADGDRRRGEMKTRHLPSVSDH